MMMHSPYDDAITRTFKDGENAIKQQEQAAERRRQDGPPENNSMSRYYEYRDDQFRELTPTDDEPRRRRRRAALPASVRVRPPQRPARPAAPATANRRGAPVRHGAGNPAAARRGLHGTVPALRGSTRGQVPQPPGPHMRPARQPQARGRRSDKASAGSSSQAEAAGRRGTSSAASSTTAARSTLRPGQGSGATRPPAHVRLRHRCRMGSQRAPAPNAAAHARLSPLQRRRGVR
jgi:hypothetical protein